LSRSTLELSSHVVVAAEGGLLEVEYVLFDGGDIELQSMGPGTNRESGYRTSAGKAQARLSELGVTAALAEEAAAALAPIAGGYARGAAIRCIIDRLGPAELFEGHLFDPGTGLFRGAWLDLPALAMDLGFGGASAALQALHLAAMLAERSDDESVFLSTAEVMAQRRPGERTFRRVALENVERIVPVMRRLGPPSPRARMSAGPSREQVVDRLRERADRAPSSRDLLPGLEAALAAREQPANGPLADAELWGIEVRLSEGDASGVLEELDALEKRRGRLPGTAYLRARAELWLRPEEPLEIAERISALSTSMPAFHELELLAAQAWAAAGDVRRAKAFARDLLENATAVDTIRLQARLVLEELEGRPGAATSARAAAAGSVSAPMSASLRIPRAPRAPTGVGAEPPPSSGREPARDSSGREKRAALKSTRPSRPAPPSAAAPTSGGWATRSTDRAPARPSSSAPPSSPPSDAAERVETLSLPAGLQGMPAPSTDEPPRAPPAARLAFTFLSRELGRELRMRHGIEIRTDLEGLELAQRYLREKLSDGRVRSREDERELMRNGAFLSEVLARRLGAHWTDLEANDSTRWTMLIPPPAGGTRAGGGAPANHETGGDPQTPREPLHVWPFARVARFVAMGHKERDLVSYYLELEARSRHFVA
jgi:hypothetical protein